MGRRVICAFSGAGEDDEAGAADEACSDTEWLTYYVPMIMLIGRNLGEVVTIFLLGNGWSR